MQYNRYLYYCALISLLFSIYLISFSLYNFPSADDFVYGAKHSLNSFSLAINSYLYGSSGRIFSNTLYHFFAGISNNNLIIYQILPIFTFIFFGIVIYLLLSIILKSFNKKDVFALTCIFIFIWLLSLNSMNDTVFWYGGIFNYLFPMTLMFFSIYLLLKAYYTDSLLSRLKSVLILNMLVLIIAFMFILFAPGSSNRAGGGILIYYLAYTGG